MAIAQYCCWSTKISKDKNNEKFSFSYNLAEEYIYMMSFFYSINPILREILVMSCKNNLFKS